MSLNTMQLYKNVIRSLENIKKTFHNKKITYFAEKTDEFHLLFEEKSNIINLIKYEQKLYAIEYSKQ